MILYRVLYSSKLVSPTIYKKLVTFTLRLNTTEKVTIDEIQNQNTIIFLFLGSIFHMKNTKKYETLTFPRKALIWL